MLTVYFFKDKITKSISIIYYLELKFNMMVPTPKDPYEHIRYNQAFNQDAIYEKHRPLLEQLGCAKNVFSSLETKRSQSISLGNSGHVVIDITQGLLEESNLDLISLAQETDLYVKDCLKKLNSARRMALAEPGIYALTEMGLVGCGAAVAMTALGSGSMGGSFAGFAAVFDSLRLVRGAIHSAHNLISWPDNPLQALENQFAINKLYIPRALWPKIIRAFVSARQNEFSREQHTNFIDFALGFTIYKPKEKISFKNDMSVQQVKIKLSKKIDNFFREYELENEDYLDYIKINISKFIDLLTADRMEAAAMQAPRYIYLHGPGGIGKTHFVQTLSEWIEEFIPRSVQFEDLVINSSDELEGNADRPGAFLRVLRNQLIKNKMGSVIIIDEATWLNDETMISPAKRIFNGDRSKLSTTYFGTTIEGTGVSLEIPPMLIFVASNDPIKDPALKSRFDVIQYPRPNLEALTKHACKIASASSVIKQRGVIIDRKVIAEWIAKLGENCNFRYIAGNIEAFLLNAKKQVSFK